MTTRHTLPYAAYRAFRTRYFARLIPILLIALVGGWYAAGADTNLLTFGPFLGVVVAVMIFSLWRTAPRHLRAFRSLCIELSDDRIRRTQEGFASFEILFSEITAITETTGKGLIVQGRASSQRLFVPATVDHYDEIRSRLVAQHAILVRPPSALPGLTLVAAILVPMIALIILYRSHSRTHILAAGAVVLAVLGYCGYAIARSPQVDRRTKRSLWVMGLVAASVVAVMLAAWLSPR